MFKSLGHFFTAVAKYIVKGAAALAVAEQKVQGAGPMIETITAFVYPPAVAVEEISFRLLGEISHAVHSAGDAATANGLNLQLDAALVAEIRALLPAMEAWAKSVGMLKPAVSPAPVLAPKLP